MDADERQILRELATRLLQSGQPETLVAELVDSDMASEVWADDEAVALLFGLYGAAAETSTLLDHYTLQPAGALPGRLVLPPLGSTLAPGRSGPSGTVIDGLVAAADNESAYVAATDSGEVFVIAAHQLDVTPAPGFDPGLRIARVSGSVATDAAAPMPGANWPQMVVRAARALAFELLGVADGALERAAEHVRTRHQFGRPLGAFQVVRHRLANAAVAIAGAGELVRAAGPDIEADEAVRVVKAAAGQAALRAVAEAQQVCGGMGFTEEFGLHRLVRRAYLLDSLLEGCEAADIELGHIALETGRIPEPELAL
jgi:hypothetical protein